MIHFPLAVLIASAMLIVGGGAAAQPHVAETTVATPPGVTRTAERMQPLLDQLAAVPEGFPGWAVVITSKDGAPFIYAHGVSRAEEGSPVTADTPFYIASQTKSFVGLMAARLDRDGVLPLDTTLAEIWPTMSLPAPADPETITLRQLLSHQQLFGAAALNIRTALVGELPVAEYPAILAEYAEAREAGFRYDNLGYLVYAAALETRTGKSWRDWLTETVLQPIGMSRTSPRSSVYPPTEVSWSHQWSGDSFFMKRPKADATMHAAGGLFSSASDQARWLQANLRGNVPGNPALGPATFRAAHTALSDPELRDGQFTCGGYALGEMICAYNGVRILVHSGGFIGARSLSAFLPEQGVGFAVMINSDTETANLTQQLLLLFVDFLIEDPTADARGKRLAEDYAQRARTFVETRRKRLARAQANPAFGAWTWRPAKRDLTRYEGRFRNDALGEMVVTKEGDALEACIGAYVLDLTPAQPNVFGAAPTPFEPPDVFAYETAGPGPATAVTWDKFRFERAP